MSRYSTVGFVSAMTCPRSRGGVLWSGRPTVFQHPGRPSHSIGAGPRRRSELPIMSQATFEKIRENYQRACDTSHPRPDKLFARTIREQIGLGHSRNVSAENPEGYYLRPDGFPMLA